MSTTTTIRLPEDLKARITAAAKRAGKTPHGLIVEAIAEKADAEERRSAFNELAEQRYASLVASGKAIPWSEMRAYLEDRIAGNKPRRPSARKLAR
jgi:predicted transcriptional regulator